MLKVLRWQYISLYNLLLPFVLTVAFLLRINFASFVYLVFCLFIPSTVSSPLAKYPGHPKRFLFCLGFWAVLCLCSQTAYNAVPKLWLKTTFLFDIGRSPRRKAVEFRQPDECKYFVSLLAQFGLGWVRVGALQPIFAAFSSDVIVLVTCTVLYLRIRALQKSKIREYLRKFGSGGGASGEGPAERAGDDEDFANMTACFHKHASNKHAKNFSNSALNLAFCGLSCVAGCIYPCLLCLPYFAIFVFMATSWAFRHPLRTSTCTSLKRFTHSFLFAHICVLYIYQLPNVNSKLPQTLFVTRLLGLVQYANDPCNQITVPLPVESWVWPEICYPFLLLLLYWLVATQLNLLRERNEFFISSASSLSADESADENEHKSLLSRDVGESVESVKAAKSEYPIIGEISSGNKLLNGGQEYWRKMASFLGFLNGSSYVFCLLIMMAWSLLYHSWSTFVLLIAACLVWMHPKTQQIFHTLIPFVSAYAVVLLVCSYIYSFPLTQSELPDENPGFLRQIGLEKPRDHAPFLDLMLKSAFNFVFWLTLYRRRARADASVSHTVAGADLWRKLSHFGNLESVKVVASAPRGQKKRAETRQENLLQKSSTILNLILSNFWILFVLAMLLAISVQNPVALYRIIYMALFLAFVNLFQISFRKWRRFMHTFWMIIIGYCLFLLTLLYTYQFHGIPELYVERLGLAEDVTRSLGLERFSSGRLLFRLMTPICFLIFSLIQVNYCHEKVMTITQHWENEAYGLKLRFLMAKLKLFYRQTNYLEGALGVVPKEGARSDGRRRSSGAFLRVADGTKLPLPSKEQMKIVIGKLERKFKHFLKYRFSIWNILWRAFEIHFHKLVAFYMVYVALSEVSILNFLLIVAAGALLCSDIFTDDIINLSSVLSSIIVILKMLYQLEFIKEEQTSQFCFNEVLNETATVRFGEWYGLYKTDTIFHFTQIHIVLVLLLASKTVIHIRQFMHRKAQKLEEPPRGILFPGIDRAMADLDLFHCFLYFANYFFYRFGVEICLIVTATTIGYRNDFISLIYASALVFLFLIDRQEKSNIWQYYMVLLYGLFVWQYLLCVGIPDYFCWGYPWDDLDRKMINWLYLPSSWGKPNPHKLFVDFAQLLCVSCQMYVFKLEAQFGANYPGGSNDESNTVTKARQFLLSFNLRLFKIQSAHKTSRKIAVPDFISESKSLLDKLKEIFFMYFYWITLSIIFVAGTTRVTIFSAGYLFGAFLFLWKGNSLFFKPILVIIKLWDLLILYNVIVIFLKVLLQVIGCVYLGSVYVNFCWFIQLFGIACNNFSDANVLIDEKEMANILAECDIPHQESGIFYDGLCFAFLIVQRRVFGSEYFKHVIVELYSQKFFAARGAELISLIRRQEVHEAAEKERNILAKVKTKMQKIKRKHEKEVMRPIEEIVENPLTPTTSTPNPLSQESSPSAESPTSDAAIRRASEQSSVSATDFSHLRMRKISAPVMSSMSSGRKKASRLLKIPSVVEENENEDNSEEEWSVTSSGGTDRLAKTSPSRKSAVLESGVKGLGPLQLLNFAFKKGALSDAMKESNEIEATHDLLERQMEQTYGISDYQSIRRAILKQKARQKTKADYDEDTFDNESFKIGEDERSFLRVPGGSSSGAFSGRRRSISASSMGGTPPFVVSAPNTVAPVPQKATVTSVSSSSLQSTTTVAPSHSRVTSGASDASSGVSDFISAPPQFKSTRRFSKMPILPKLVIHEANLIDFEEDDIFTDINSERQKPKSRIQRIRHKYANVFGGLVKVCAGEFLRNLCLFLFMFAAGVLESLISYLMRISRDYRYIAYILREEKRIHKQMMSNSSTDHENNHMTRADRQHHREIIDQTVQESGVKPLSGVLRDESFRELHRSLTAKRRKPTTATDISDVTETANDEGTTGNGEKSRYESTVREKVNCNVARRASAGNLSSSDETAVSAAKPRLQRSDSFDSFKLPGSRPSIFNKLDAPDELWPQPQLQTQPQLKPQRIALEILEGDEKIRLKTVPQTQPKKPKSKIDANKSGVNLAAENSAKLQHKFSSMSFREDTLQDEKEPIVVRLIVAIYYAVLSRSEMICYLMIVLNHIFTASLLSMPLPLMMLLWGTLTVPKPTKRFWIILIAYTEFMVVLKYVFQFGFFPWIHGAPSLDPFWPPRILGIEKRPKYAAWDLALLMALFLHRNILMSIGLWKNEAELEAEEEKEEEKHHIFVNNLHKNHHHSHLIDHPAIEPAIDPTFSHPTGSNGDTHRPSVSTRHTSIISAAFSRRPTFRFQSFAEIVSELSQSRTVIKTKMRKRVGRVRTFFGSLLNAEEDRYPVDVYAPMFICDAICFLVVIFGYSSFGTDQGAGSVTAYFQENKVPGTLVAMLIIQFILMVVDRALFLRKFLFGKLVFQVAWSEFALKQLAVKTQYLQWCFKVFLVVFVHVWMFLLLPGATGRLFAKNFACQLWYFVKIIYFIISAKQIRAGYPKRQLGNVISNTYSAIYMFLYKIYMMIPFLFELSLLMDWMWIDTCLGLSNWITLHDIYSNVSMIKCERNIEEDYPSPKGVKQRALHKYGRGGFLLFLIILIIWFPLVLFSMANTVGTRSVPVECTAKLTISGYQPLFESTARLGDIRSLTVDEYNDLYFTYRTSKTALSYIADYDNEDVVVARIDGNSSSRWQISPPARNSLVNNLNGSQHMSIQFDWQFKRAPDENLQYGSVENFRVVELEPGSSIRAQFVDTIRGGANSTTQIFIPNLFPPMVEVPGEGKSDSVNALLHEHLKGEFESQEKAFTSVYLELESAEGVEWWKVRMIDPMFDPIRISEPVVRNHIVFYGFVDKVFPKSFSFITGGGILGLYVSIVLVLGHYVRGMVSDSMKKVMFEELPNVDRLLQLCNDIFLVRDAGEFGLEEDLFAKLVFIFRSPATLIKWTREDQD